MLRIHVPDGDPNQGRFTENQMRAFEAIDDYRDEATTYVVTKSAVSRSDELHGDPWYRGFAAGFRFGFLCLDLWLSVALLCGFLLGYFIVMKF